VLWHTVSSAAHSRIRVALAQLLAATAGKPLILEEFGVTRDPAMNATLPYPSRDAVFIRCVACRTQDEP